MKNGLKMDLKFGYKFYTFHLPALISFYMSLDRYTREKDYTCTAHQNEPSSVLLI